MSGSGNRLHRRPVKIDRRGSGVDLLDKPSVQHPPQHRGAVAVKLRPDLVAGRVTEVGGDLPGGTCAHAEMSTSSARISMHVTEYSLRLSDHADDHCAIFLPFW